MSCARSASCRAGWPIVAEFAKGDHCLLTDGKGRKFLLTLDPGSVFHFHNGMVAHDDIIGRPQGSVVKSSLGGRLVAVQPRLADYILNMKRGAQVVYPKDIGPILVWGDIGPDMTVLEAGTGSGALTMALVRAVGPVGRVVSVERRYDHAEHAQRALEAYFLGLPPNLELRVGEVADQVADVGPDRLVLDLPEPFGVVEAAAESLPSGAIWVSYVPTIPQVQQTTEALRAAGCFAEISNFETMHREWNIDGRSVRPDHRMVGHTGFITVARKIDPA
ncbi:MAG: tRNA (adenine-N1)-methyltransferase [Acidimicrobiia bacterium]|nr:tRNA (adenine-N1)-methyltransferase [Acidimicrobiia bacterium]